MCPHSNHTASAAALASSEEQEASQQGLCLEKAREENDELYEKAASADQAISQSDSENEDRMLSKIVNMKKNFFGSYTSTTSKEANQTKRRRQQEDADAVRDGVATEEQAVRFHVTRSCARL